MEEILVQCIKEPFGDCGLEGYRRGEFYLAKPHQTQHGGIWWTLKAQRFGHWSGTGDATPHCTFKRYFKFIGERHVEHGKGN